MYLYGPYLDSLSDDAQRELLALIESAVGEALQGHASSASDSKPWLSVAEAAERLNVSESSIRDAIKRKALPSHRVERRVLLRTEDVDRLPRKDG